MGNAIKDGGKTRPLTEDEARERFLAHVWVMIRFWQNESRVQDVQGKLEGLAFSIMSSLDGSSGGLPRFIVAPSPHKDDKNFCAKEGIDWWKAEGDDRNRHLYWPENKPATCDISGCLHEQFQAVGVKKGFVKKNG